MNEEYNYYELLGVSQNATKEEIEFKYQEIINFLNPGNHPNKTYSAFELEEARDRMEVVTLAYSALINPKTRKAYDEEMKNISRRKVEEQERNMGILPQESRKRRSTRRLQEERKTDVAKKDEESYSYRRPKQEKKETFLQSIKRQYKEVRSDEKRNTLRMRHTRISDAYREEFLEKVTTVPKEMLYYVGKGLTHASLETIYQLSKLRYVNKDAFTKYLIRNRKLIATATLAGMIFSSGIVSGSEKDQGIVREAEDYTPRIETQAESVEEPLEETTALPVYEPRMILNRNYTILKGDTLSRLASNANSSISELKQINGYETDDIYYGRKMQIPYTIDTEDLEFYTESVKVNDYTLEELAKIYETDIETLYKLNPEAIMKIGDNTYYVLSDSLIVPKFITKQEYWDAKQAKSFRYE